MSRPRVRHRPGNVAVLLVPGAAMRPDNPPLQATGRSCRAGASGAFGYAAAVQRDDRKMLDDLLAAGLLAAGLLIEVNRRRSRGALSRPPDAVLVEGHPLAVTIRPRRRDGFQPVLPVARDGNTAAAKNRPAQQPR